MMKRIYVGPKLTTIENNDFFDGSITLFDSTATFEYWNPDNIPHEVSIYNEGLAKITEPTEVMAHHPLTVSKCKFPENVRMICLNPLSVLQTLDDKIQTRGLLSGLVPMLDYRTIKGKDFNYEQLRALSDELVVQLPVGSGGSKTFLCNPENHEQIRATLVPDKDYSISAYQRENTPYNVHCIVGNDRIEVLPPSQQLLEISDKIEFIGSDFEIEIPSNIKAKFIQHSSTICNRVQALGYRGVLGIDYIHANDELYFIEINPRFQGSTRQVDALLKKSGLPSIFDYNYRAFNGDTMPCTKHMEASIFSRDHLKASSPEKPPFNPKQDAVEKICL